MRPIFLATFILLAASSSIPAFSQAQSETAPPADTFAESTRCGGYSRDDGRALRFLEWAYDPDPTDTTIVVEFALMIREGVEPTRVEHDVHIAGLFDRATWLDLMRGAGLAPINPNVPDPYAGQHEVFVGRRLR